jgi:7-carboxy-7-deazaguanine synthase
MDDITKMRLPSSMKRNALWISEIFYSLQGEGIDAGIPAVFIRTALCNLSCSWCDTKYTWDWNHYSYNKEVKEMTLPEIHQNIARFSTKHCVITGGEPLIQQGKLVPLLYSLKHREYFIEIETNGTILPSDEIVKLVDRWNVSPKLANSAMAKDKREVENCLGYFANNSGAYLKFVICNPIDITEVENIVEAYMFNKQRVILMPEGNSPEEILEKSRWLAEICMNKGYILSLRLHTLLWSGTRAK